MIQQNTNNILKANISWNKMELFCACHFSTSEMLMVCRGVPLQLPVSFDQTR